MQCNSKQSTLKIHVTPHATLSKLAFLFIKHYQRAIVLPSLHALFSPYKGRVARRNYLRVSDEKSKRAIPGGKEGGGYILAFTLWYPGSLKKIEVSQSSLNCWQFLFLGAFFVNDKPPFSQILRSEVLGLLWSLISFHLYSNSCQTK